MANTPNSVAIAGGAISVALIDALVQKGLISADTAAEILTDAQARLQPYLADADAVSASQIISGLFQGLPKNHA